MTSDVRVFGDVDDLSRRAAEAVATTITETARATGRCSLVLSGGETPRSLYRVLATRFGDRIPWAQTHVFWGDERYVPPGDPRRNDRMARETLLDHVPCPATNIHPMPADFPEPDDAARDYEATLRRFFTGEWPAFDLVLLGVGADGHTASLFPGSRALAEAARWVLAVSGPADPPTRLTLTLPALNHSTTIYVLVAGSSKAPALREILAERADVKACPAAGIRPDKGALVWWADREAAAQLKDAGSRGPL